MSEGTQAWNLESSPQISSFPVRGQSVTRRAPIRTYTFRQTSRFPISFCSVALRRDLGDSKEGTASLVTDVMSKRSISEDHGKGNLERDAGHVSITQPSFSF